MTRLGGTRTVNFSQLLTATSTTMTRLVIVPLTVAVAASGGAPVAGSHRTLATAAPSSVQHMKGLHWLFWHSYNYSLKAVSMAFQATN